LVNARERDWRLSPGQAGGYRAAVIDHEDIIGREEEIAAIARVMHARQH
jgi:hypothetical protein